MFVVPPQINPFNFGEEAANFGDFVTVNCAISKGDFPFNFTWTLNGKPINSFDGITMVNTNKRNSQMTIEFTQAHHTGEFTCIAKNFVGEARYSAYLNVNGIYILSPISFF